MRTANYNLPLWKEDTVTSWMVDLNYAMVKIDETMHILALRSSITGSPSEELVATVEKLEGRTQELMMEIDLLHNMQPVVNNHTEQLANLTNIIGVLQTNYVALDTRMTAAETAIQSLNIAVQKLQETINNMNKGETTNGNAVNS